MDTDDPEQRIAELERQLAQARATRRPARATGGDLTPELVHNVAVSKPPIGKRGYNEDQVDAFLARVEAALRDPAGGQLTAEQVHSVAFSKPPIGMRGYHEDEVDAFLELVEQHIGRSPQAVDTPEAAAPP